MARFTMHKQTGHTNQAKGALALLRTLLFGTTVGWASAAAASGQRAWGSAVLQDGNFSYSPGAVPTGIDLSEKTVAAGSVKPTTLQ